MNTKRTFITSVLLSLLTFAGAWTAAGADATLTAATGGSAISADSFSSGSWTALTGPVLTETAIGQIGTGTIIIDAPTGFEFNTAAIVVARVKGHPITSANNINDLASNATITVTVAASSLTLTITAKSAGGPPNVLTWENVQVRPTVGPLASGDLSNNSGTAGNVPPTGWGTLTMVAGALDHFSVTAAAPQFAGTGQAFLTTITAQDQFNNTVTTDTSTVTMTGTGSVAFDSDGNGTFGDNTKTLVNGTNSISTRDTVAETLNITATSSPKSGTLTGFLINSAPVSGDYRSRVTGQNWATANTWETNNGTAWVTASSPPTSAHGVITIRSGHVVTVANAVTADQIIVQSGGTLTVNNNLTLNNGAGTDLDIFGTLNGNSAEATIPAATTVVLESGGILDASSAGADLAVNGSLTVVGGTVTTSINKGITGTGILTLSNGTVHVGSAGTGGADFKFTGTLNLAGGLMTIGQNWSGTPTNGTATGGTVEFLSGAGGGFTGLGTNKFFNVLIDSGANVNFDGAAGNVTRVAGNWTNNGTATLTGNANTIRFNGSGSTQYVAGSSTTTFYNMIVDSNASVALTVNATVTTGTATVTNGGTLNCGTTVLSGNGTFVLGSGGTLGIGASGGITSAGANGNIQTTVRSYNTNANYVFNGSAAQSSSGLPSTIRSLTINNTGGTVTLPLPTTIGKNVTLVSGAKLSLPVPASTSETLVIGGAGQASGSWGNTGSGATHIDATHFAGAGVLNVSNVGPVANDATYNRAPLQTLKINIASLIATSTSDGNGDTLTLTGLGTPTGGGTVSISSGRILYTPPGGDGNDTFTYTVSDGSLTGTGTITVNKVTPGGLAQSINTSGGSVIVNFSGIPGYSYAIERSTDLSVWTVLQTTNTPANGQFSYTDGTPPMPSAYYRTKQN